MDAQPQRSKAEEPMDRGTVMSSGPVHFFVNRFLFGFCSHWPLPLVLMLLVCLGLGLGEGFGVTDLIYHEHKEQQILGGATLALVVVACVYAGFVLDTRRFPLVPGRGWYDIPHWGFWLYFPGVLGSFLACLVAGGAAYWVVASVLIQLRSVSGLNEVWNPFALFANGRDYGWLPVGLLAGLAYALAAGTVCYQFIDRLSRARSGREEPVPGALLVPGVRVPVTESTGTEFRRFLSGPDADPAGQPAAKPGTDVRAATDAPRKSRREKYLEPFWLGGRQYPAAWLTVWLLSVFLLIHIGSCAVVRAGEWKAWVGSAATAVLLTLICVSRRRQLARLVTEVRASRGDTAADTGLESYHYRSAGLLFVAVTLALFWAADTFLGRQYGVGSPVPLVGMALFTFLAVYALLGITYRQALPVVFLGAAVLVVLAGIPPYKFRFPVLEARYSSGDTGDPAAGLVNLGATIDRENEWAKADEQTLKALADRKLNPLEHPAAFAAVKEQIRGRHYRIQTPPQFPAPEKAGKEWRNPALRKERAAWQHPEKGVLVPYYDIPFNRGAAREEDKKPLLIVTVSGGGHAAAVWTLGVLNRLEAAFAERGIDFPGHVLFMTGASGGMMGAAYYVVSLPDAGTRTAGYDRRRAELAAHKLAAGAAGAAAGADKPPPPGRLDDQIGSLLKEDFLTPIVNRMLFNDLPAYFSPFPNFQDRGRMLEESWEKTFELPAHLGRDKRTQKSPFRLTFQDLKDRELSGDYPFLVFTPMMIEDGRRLLVSNLDLSSVVSNDGNGLDATTVVDKAQNYTYSREGLEFFRLFPEQHGTVKLSTVARMSATFPFFSPAVSLPTIPRRRVVDAGYYDNYGVSVAASWLFSTSHQDWMADHVSKVAVIQIRGSLGEGSRRLQTVAKSSDNLLSRAMEEAISPLEGLNQARVGSSSFRNDGQLELLSKYFRETKESPDDPRPAHVRRFFTTVTFELSEDVALSWYLGAKDQTAIRNALKKGEQDGFGGRLQYLLDWFEEPRRVPAGEPPAAGSKRRDVIRK